MVTRLGEMASIKNKNDINFHFLINSQSDITNKVHRILCHPSKSQMVISDGHTFRLMHVPTVTSSDMIKAYLSGNMHISSVLTCWEMWWNVASCVSLRAQTATMVR